MQVLFGNIPLVDLGKTAWLPTRNERVYAPNIYAEPWYCRVEGKVAAIMKLT
ncbi:hypothetical protein CCP3SC1_370016 [Gammaproteobacteria bacterium]